MPKKCIVTTSSEEMKDLYDEEKKTNKDPEKTDYPTRNPEYSDRSLEELVMETRSSKEAMSELLIRMSSDMYSQARYYANMRPELTFDEILTALQKAAYKAAVIFDEKKGSFLHLYRAMALKCVKSLSYKVRRKNSQDYLYFGVRYPYSESGLVADVSFEARDTLSIAAKVDVDDFLDSLDFQDHQIFFLYIKGFSRSEIADVENLSYSEVSNIIRRLIEQFKSKYGK